MVKRSRRTSGRTLSTEPGERAVRFINNLTHTKGDWAGKPFNLRPWQEAVVRKLFGTIRSDGLRQYRTCYVEIPRKNGKSEIAAAVALYLLFGDGEMGAEVYGAATDRDQASLVFNVADQMVTNDPVLAARLKPIRSQKRLVDYRTGSFYRAISAEAYSKHGFNASGVVYDELHAAPNRDLWDVLNTSMGSRSQPLTLAITTAGYDRNSICWEIHSYAERVLAGEVDDPTFLPVIYAAGPDDDWLDEAVWRKCNPALEDFRSLDELRVAAKRAQEIPAQENVFRRLYLNQWTEQSTRWLPMDAWDACDGVVDPEALRGRICYGGLDLSTTTDLSALALVFPSADGTFDVLLWLWCPAEGIKRRGDRDRVPYEEWVRRGLMTATEGNVVDYQSIRQKIVELAAAYDIREIAYDRWNSHAVVTELTDDGATMVPFGQGFASMTAPSKELEKLVVGGMIRHGGNPALRWMASNVAARSDPAGNLKPDKEKSGERIDGIVALVMALGRAIVAENPVSVYEERGLISL